MELKEEMMDIWSKIEDVNEKIRNLSDVALEGLGMITYEEAMNLYVQKADRLSAEIREKVKTLCRIFDDLDYQLS